MASFSSGKLSGKVLIDPKTGKKMNFLDMSLDDIIILKELNDKDFEDTETVNERQDCEKRNSVSKRRSNTHRTRQQRGYSSFRNNREERNHDKSQDPSGFKPGQSPLKNQPLIKQEKRKVECYEVQSQRNEGRSKRNQHQSGGNQVKSDGKRGKSEENQHHSKRSHWQLERSRDQSERSHGHKDRSYGQSERSHGHTDRSRGRSERSHGKSERYRFKSERSYDQAERSFDHSERSRGYSERSYDHSERYHGQSGRSHGQSQRYQRYSRIGRFQASSKTESEFDRSSVKRQRKEYSQNEMQWRNIRMNINRKIMLGNDRHSDENTRRHERYMKHGVETLLLASKCATTKSSMRQPRGINLKFNFQATGNQTKISLNERFSKLKTSNSPEPTFGHGRMSKSFP
ncbi:leucine zipper protein 4 [Tamandua tetradactyla]|uniref:leucine zipper protein 4 n=1 Tax=Tamandua tetradactyla TaxID=48850 RepID=UPI0040537BEB